jgi:DNA-directed RNA polymerase specialized sigma24 family protein
MQSHSLAREPQELDVSQTLDHALIKRVAIKDLEALRELHLRYQSRLVLFLARMTLRFDLAERLACDTWTEVWKQAPRFRDRCRASLWIYRIAHQRGLEAAGEEDIGSGPILEQRAALALAYGLNLPSTDVAFTMRRTISAVRLLMISACHLEYSRPARSQLGAPHGRKAGQTANVLNQEDFR